MKKKLLGLVAGIIAVIGVFSFAACGDENDSDKDNSGNDNTITDSNENNGSGNGDSSQNNTGNGNAVTEYIFEAEDTYVNQIKGGNFSSNPTGKQCVYQDSTGVFKASNNYYVGSLSAKDATVEFEIYSDKAVSNVKFVIRVSSNTFDFNLSSNKTSEQYYEISVNGEPIDYGSIKVTKGTEFVDIEIGNISLKATSGDEYNSITFVTANNYSPTSGIFAAAPAIDCIKLYTNDAVLKQEKYEGNY